MKTTEKKEVTTSNNEKKNQLTDEKKSKLTDEQKAKKKAKKANEKKAKFEKTLYIGRDVSIYRFKSVLNLESEIYKKVYDFSQKANVGDKIEIDLNKYVSYDNENSMNKAEGLLDVSNVVILCRFLSSENHNIYLQQLEDKRYYLVCSKYEHQTNSIKLLSNKYYDLNEKGDLTKNNALTFFFNESIDDNSFNDYLSFVSDKNNLLKAIFNDDLLKEFNLTESEINVSVSQKIINFVNEIIEHKKEIGSYTFNGLSD